MQNFRTCTQIWVFLRIRGYIIVNVCQFPKSTPKIINYSQRQRGGFISRDEKKEGKWLPTKYIMSTHIYHLPDDDLGFEEHPEEGGGRRAASGAGGRWVSGSKTWQTRARDTAGVGTTPCGKHPGGGEWKPVRVRLRIELFFLPQRATGFPHRQMTARVVLRSTRGSSFDPHVAAHGVFYSFIPDGASYSKHSDAWNRIWHGVLVLLFWIMDNPCREDWRFFCSELPASNTSRRWWASSFDPKMETCKSCRILFHFYCASYCRSTVKVETEMARFFCFHLVDHWQHLPCGLAFPPQRAKCFSHLLLRVIVRSKFETHRVIFHVSVITVLPVWSPVMKNTEYVMMWLFLISS